MVCPRTSTGGVDEVQAGFPGAKLKLTKGRYGFSVKYTENSADLTTISPVFGHSTHTSATVSVTGTVSSSRLIVGTVSVHAAGCSLPKTKYKATHG